MLRVALAVVLSAFLALMASMALAHFRAEPPAPPHPDSRSAPVTAPPEPAPDAVITRRARAETGTVRAGAKDSRWPGLPNAIHAAMANYPGQYSVVVVDLATGGHWEYNGDAIYHPASLVKLPTALFAEHRINAGEWEWEAPLTYTEADFEPEDEIAPDRGPFGSQFSVADLVHESLYHSSNIAVNILGRSLGWENIRQFTYDIGGELQSGPRATANAVSSWWLYLWRLHQTAPKRSEHLLAPLRETPYQGRIAAGTPAGVPLVHKYGSYLGNEHDGAIVWASRPYVLVVMTAGGPVSAADIAITRVAEAVWNYFDQGIPTGGLRP